jgi:Leucine-rich repeat (LRR) protein
MKKIIVAILLSPLVFCAQLTRIPDSNFEQQLINLGYDDVLDGGVITIDISTVQQLNISNSNISDISGIEDFIALESLNCMNNYLTSLPINENVNLETLNCYGNYLNSMDLNQNPMLKYLNCGNNILLSLDVNYNYYLEELYCSNNNLFAIDLLSNSNLEIFHCNDNVITDLNLVSNVALINLQCEGNLLVDLDLTSNVYLESISCAFNQIVDLDLFLLENLNNINCSSNAIKTLDFANNNQLEILNCSINELKKIDLSANTNLRGLDCSSNGLRCLNVKNGNNFNFLFFDASSNKDLQCLEVDDELAAATNWSSYVDPSVVFSTFCANPCSVSLTDLSELDSEFSVFPNPTHQTINISIKASLDFTAELLDCTGRLITTTTSNQLDVSDLAFGSYYLRLIIGGQIHVSKIIKN